MEGISQYFKTHRRLVGTALIVLAVGAFSLLHTAFTSAEQATLIVEPGVQPPVKTLLSGDQVVTFTTFRMTAVGGDVTITNMSMDQVGVANDALLSVVQFRELATGQHLGRAKAIPGAGIYNSNYEMVLKEGETKDYILIANVGTLTSYNNQHPQLALTGIDTTAEIQGEFPIVGTAHVTNANVTAGTASIAAGPGDPNSGNKVQIEEDVLFNSMRLTATSAEPITPSFTIWHFSASASYEHLSNIRTEIVYKGETYTFPTFPYATGSDPNEQWISILAGAPEIARGDSYVMNIRGEVSSKALGETVDFVDLAKAGVYHTGSYYGALTVAAALYDSPASTVSGGSTVLANVHSSNTWYEGEPEIRSFTIQNGSGDEMMIYGMELDLTVPVTNLRIWNRDTGAIVAGPANTNDDGVATLNAVGSWILEPGSGRYVITADNRASVEGQSIVTMKSVGSAAMFNVKSTD